MNPGDPNVAAVELVAAALGDLREKLVFVGGSTTGILITDDARPAVRATKDVDLIAEVATISGYYELATELRRLGFTEDMEVTCRWRFNDVKVDVMPTNEKILGFSNRWYGEAIEFAVTAPLPHGMPIKLITPPYFIATKIEAFHGRGGGDFGSSHDIEDIVTLVDGRPSIVDEIGASSAELIDYLSAEVDALLGNPDFADTLGWHFAPDEANQRRVEEVIARLRRIADLT